MKKKRNAKRSANKYIIVKLLKNRKNLQSNQKKMSSHIQGDPIKINRWLLMATVKTRRQWDDIFQCWKKMTWSIKNHTHQNYLSKMKAKERHLTPRKTQTENLLLTESPYKKHQRKLFWLKVNDPRK